MRDILDYKSKINCQTSYALPATPVYYNALPIELSKFFMMHNFFYQLQKKMILFAAAVSNNKIININNINIKIIQSKSTLQIII
jgi:hypothetical protein